MKQIEHQADRKPIRNDESSANSNSLDSPLPSPSSMTAPRRSSLARRIMKGMVLTAAVMSSAVVGLVVAVVMPLPVGMMPTEGKSRASLDDLWQVGFLYRVARPVNVLIMGIDRVPDAKPGTPDVFNGRSDTMLLLRLDPSTDSVSLLSIPRDTQVVIPNVGVVKINDANVEGGAQLAAETVSQTLNGVAIDRYVRVSTEAFRELVDQLGGLEVNVPKPMSYQDQTQKLKIELSPGLQTLNGDQAEQFARFRQDAYGDIGRVQRQQLLLKALRNRVSNPAILPKIPSLLQTMQQYIDTNLSLEEMLALVSAGRKLSDGSLKMVMLPGRFSAPDEFVASYWIMDPVGRDRVMRQYFGVEPTTSDANLAHPAADLRIAVQNSSSHPDAAYYLRQYLANHGFYNVYLATDGSTTTLKQTQIIVQKGDLEAAKTIQQQLGYGKIEANSTGDLESDLTIRIGEDWKPAADTVRR